MNSMQAPKILPWVANAPASRGTRTQTLAPCRGEAIPEWPDGRQRISGLAVERFLRLVETKQPGTFCSSPAPHSAGWVATRPVSLLSLLAAQNTTDLQNAERPELGEKQIERRRPLKTRSRVFCSRARLVAALAAHDNGQAALNPWHDFAQRQLALHRKPASSPARLRRLHAGEQQPEPFPS